MTLESCGWLRAGIGLRWSVFLSRELITFKELLNLGAGPMSRHLKRHALFVDRLSTHSIWPPVLANIVPLFGLIENLNLLSNHRFIFFQYD